LRDPAQEPQKEQQYPVDEAAQPARLRSAFLPNKEAQPAFSPRY